MTLRRKSAEEKQAERRAREETHAAARAAWQASQAGTPRPADNPRRRRWLLLAAAACLVASWLPLAVGAALDVYALEYWGVVTLYLGLGWLAPGILVGAAAGDRARARRKAHPTRASIAVGVAATVGFLVLGATLGAAAGLESEPGQTNTTDETRPATSTKSDRVSLVMAAAQKRRATSGPVIWVECSRSTNFCAVAFDPPACQLWVVENVDGVDKPKPVGLAIEGGSGTYDEVSDSIGCRSGASP
jgi:hypothetical protein